MSNLDRFGYYLVNGHRYISKQMALDEFKKSHKPLEFIFNDAVFDCLDWTKEPEPHVSLWEFYRRRAQQIRDQYDYVILQFSGGPDSTNILEVFERNNIRLDEIVNFNSYDQTQVVDNTLNNADYVYNVKSSLDRYLKGNRVSDTRITIIDEIDMTKKILTHYDKHQMAHDLLLGNSWSASSWMFRGVWVKHVKHVWDRILAGQRVCVIIGNDKTMLRLDDNNRYYTQFIDQNGPDTATMMSYDPDFRGNDFIEWFYHTPDMPTIPIKQAHTLKKVVDMSDANSFESMDKYTNGTYRTSFTCSSKVYPGKNLLYDLYHKTVYPFWAPSIVTPKPMYHGTRIQDNWWASRLPNDVKKIWQYNFIHMKTKFKDFITQRNSTEFSGLMPQPSKKYYLE